MNAIKIDNLTKRYKEVVAVDGLSLCIEEGELFKVDEVFAFGGVALGKDRHTSADIAACGSYELFDSEKAFAG